MKIKGYFIYWSPLVYKEIESGEIIFCRPELRFTNFKNRPCETRWLFDWILRFGWLTVMKNAPEHVPQPTPNCTCEFGSGWLERWHHSGNCKMRERRHENHNS